MPTYETFVPNLSNYIMMDGEVHLAPEPYTEREFTYSHFPSEDVDWNAKSWLGIIVYFDSQGDVRWKQNGQLICHANEVQFENLCPTPKICGYCRFLMENYTDEQIRVKLKNSMEILL